MKTLKKHWNGFATLIGTGVALIILFGALWVWGQSAPQPVLTIAPLGSNQFSLTITNALNTNRYELQWTPALNDSSYPWSVCMAGGPGQTNWSVDGSQWEAGFFRAAVTWLYNGIPDYELADPNNPSLGALSITIDSPTNGLNFN